MFSAPETRGGPQPIAELRVQAAEQAEFAAREALADLQKISSGELHIYAYVYICIYIHISIYEWVQAAEQAEFAAREMLADLQKISSG